jgi:hypothetical protein
MKSNIQIFVAWQTYGAYSVHENLCSAVGTDSHLCCSSLPIFFWPIGGVMIRVLASTAVDRGFEPRSAQTKDYKIGMCCFSAKHAALRRKSKDWLARDQNNVSEWSDIFYSTIKNQTQHVVLIQNGPHHHLIEN